VVYDNRENTGVRNNVALDDALVARYDKRGADPDLKYVEAGALIMKREVLELVKSGQAVSLEEGIYPSLIGQRELAAFVTRQRFYDIGTPAQLAEFEAFLTRKLV
jgi:NDP-sugar pyrophosphorylase family protein